MLKRLAILFLVHFLSLGAHAEIFTLTGNSPTLLTYDSDTLALTGGTPDSGGVALIQSVATDELGRVFAISYTHLYEFDPKTRQIIRQQAFPIPGLLRDIEVRNGVIYSTSGTSPVNLVTINADTFQVISGVAQTNIGVKNALAFDSSGRLFGITNNAMVEFNPITLQIIHQVTFTGQALGLAARDGVLYSLSGAATNTLVTFDPDTLLQNGGTLQTEAHYQNDLTFDSSGRLFALTDNRLMEFDPQTLALKRQATVSTVNVSLAATVPEPSTMAFVLVAVGVCVFHFLRRKRSQA